MRAKADGALAPLGLRPRHFVALTILREHTGCTQQSLAGLLSVDRTNLVGLLNDLETDGLIARRRDADDRRRHLVELTPAGEARLGEAEGAMAAAEDEVLGALDAPQRAQLHELLLLASAGQPVDCEAAAGTVSEACLSAGAVSEACLSAGTVSEACLSAAAECEADDDASC